MLTPSLNIVSQFTICATSIEAAYSTILDIECDLGQGLSLEANEQVLSVAREQQAEIDAEDRQATHYGPATGRAVRTFPRECLLL